MLEIEGLGNVCFGSRDLEELEDGWNKWARTCDDALRVGKSTADAGLIFEQKNFINEVREVGTR